MVGREKSIVKDTVLFRAEYLVSICILIRGTPLFHLELNSGPFRPFWAISGGISISGDTRLSVFFFFFLSCYVILKLKNLYYLILFV